MNSKTLIVLALAIVHMDVVDGAMMKTLQKRTLAASGLPDPHCKTGILSLPVDGRPQSCCAGYCGACNDYKTCKSARGQDSENACCASKVYEMRCGNAPANVCLKKCSEAVPPCIMDKDVDSMDVKVKVFKGVPPCNEVVPVNRKRQEIAVTKGELLADLHAAEADFKRAADTEKAVEDKLEKDAEKTKDKEISKEFDDAIKRAEKDIDAIPKHMAKVRELADAVEEIKFDKEIPRKLQLKVKMEVDDADKERDEAKELKEEADKLYEEVLDHKADKKADAFDDEADEYAKAQKKAVEVVEKKEAAEEKAITWLDKETIANDDGGGNSIYFDRHDIKCDEGRVMSQWHMTRHNGNQIKFQYKCGALPDLGACTKKETPANDVGGGNSIYFDRHDLSCGEGEAMSQWHLTREGGDKIKFQHTCCSVPGLGKCSKKETPANSDGGGNTVYFDRHNAACGKDQAMTRWHLTRHNGNQIKFQYTCCDLSKDAVAAADAAAKKAEEEAKKLKAEAEKAAAKAKEEEAEKKAADKVAEKAAKKACQDQMTAPCGQQWAFVVDSKRNLVAIKKGPKTGSGKTEVHRLTAASNYKEFDLHTPTALGMTDENMDFVMDSKDNLLGILKGPTTGSGHTEIHRMSAGSNYQQFNLQTGTGLQYSTHGWAFTMDSKDRLVCILKGPTTGSGQTEVHRLTASSGYKNFDLHTATGLGITDQNMDFVMDSNDDLVGILKGAVTGTGKTEIHRLSSSSNYGQFNLQTGTALHYTNEDDWAFAMAGKDLIGILKGTASGTCMTEVHRLSGGSNYHNFDLQTGTGLELSAPSSCNR